jgi:hypothetical protein
MTTWGVAEPFVQRLGWTLIQFLWQGTLIAVLFAALRVLLGRSLSSRARYGMACAAFALMGAAPVLTYGFSGPAGAARTTWLVPVDRSWSEAVPWVVALWMIGVCLCSIRLAGGWLVTRRLSRSGIAPPSGEWQQTFDDLVRRLRVSQPVAFVVSTLVEVPTVVGWLRPVVLMPIAMAGLPPQYIKTLLAHELAHVRRHDYIVNMLQRVGETVLFYHPAVWWISEQIRVEREMCCDDIVVATEGDVLVYARALTELESIRQREHAVLAANGPSLLHRIRRLLGHTLTAWQLLPGPSAIIAIAVVFGIGMTGLGARDRADAPPPPLASDAAPAAARHQSLLTTALLGPIGPAAAPLARSAPTQSARPGLPAPTPSVAPSTPGVIRGRVISAATGAPLANAAIVLYPEKRVDGDQPFGLGATTDSSGRYEVKDLAPRRYWARVTRRGFAPETYGSRGAADARAFIEVTPGGTIDLSDVVLSTGSVINGSIVDQGGEPIGGIVVQALRPAEWNSARPGDEASSDVTDDRGTFRIYGLSPGRYFLRALRAPVMRWEAGGYAPLAFVYYPGTSQPAQAKAVVVDKGGEAAAAFTFVLGARIVVSGTVVSADGNAVSGGTATLRPHYVDNTQRILERPIVAGTFTFGVVPPGEYILTARNTAGDEMVMKRVAIEQGSERLTVALQKAATIHGRIEFETTGSRGPIRPSDVQIGWYTQGFSPRVSGVAIRPDWSFEVTGLVGPQEFGYTPLDGWAFKEVRYGGRPPTKTAFDLQGEDVDVQVVFTDRITRISGRVTDGLNRPVSGVVVIFPEDREQWRPGVRSVTTADVERNGSYTVSALPAGRYLAIAVDGLEELTADVVDRLRSRATSVTLADGEQSTLDLKRSTP